MEHNEVQVRYWNKSVRSSTRPPAAEWKPDPERLAMRYEWFRAASAPTPTPAVFAETGVASATRLQASLRVSVSEHARKTNGVPDEPPREMRTCA